MSKNDQTLSQQEQQKPYELMDLEDEKEIIESLKGAYLEGMVYQFKQGNRTVTGISYIGVKEIAYQLARGTGREIDVDPKSVVMIETDDNYFITVAAHHQGIGTRIGAAVQPKKFSRGQLDPFAFTKAYSKAQRNALRAVIPELSIKQFVEKALEGGKIKQVDASLEASRWQDDRGNWKCNDTGIELLAEETMPLPDKIADALEKANLNPSAVVLGRYADDVVLCIPNVQTNVTPYKKVIDAITEPSKFIYCSGNKSSHWFPAPAEDT